MIQQLKAVKNIDYLTMIGLLSAFLTGAVTFTAVHERASHDEENRAFVNAGARYTCADGKALLYAMLAAMDDVDKKAQILHLLKNADTPCWRTVEIYPDDRSTF